MRLNPGILQVLEHSRCRRCSVVQCRFELEESVIKGGRSIRRRSQPIFPMYLTQNRPSAAVCVHSDQEWRIGASDVWSKLLTWLAVFEIVERYQLVGSIGSQINTKAIYKVTAILKLKALYS